MRNFEDLERQLTSFMTEKSSLEEELGRCPRPSSILRPVSTPVLITCFSDFNKEEAVLSKKEQDQHRSKGGSVI
jgi:hypothetical protein